MRWRWWRRETRSQAGGSYTALINQLIHAQAVGETRTASATAAFEASAAALGRAFSSATVSPAWAAEIVTPRFLEQLGRDLVVVGESLHVLREMGGSTILVPSSTWYWKGSSPDPESWEVDATAYGPTGSTTWRLPRDQVVFMTWGRANVRPYQGLGPATLAADTAKLHGEAERSLADEAAGPIAQLLAIPQDGGDGGDEDPLAMLKQDLKDARGKALLLETTSSGWAEGRGAAPGNGNRDWVASRLGPSPGAAMVDVAEAAFRRTLAACGTPPALFTADADGTAQREALRRWHMNTVLPLAKILEHELALRLETPVKLTLDRYPQDIQGRAMSFAKMVQAGMDLDRAAAISGVLAEDPE